MFLHDVAIGGRYMYFIDSWSMFDHLDTFLDEEVSLTASLLGF